MNFHISLDRYEKKYKHKHLALYYAVREAIVNGTIPDGTRLPSTRELAEFYQVSRGTITLAYDMLAAEGYILSEVGRGTFVHFNQTRYQQSVSFSANISLSPWGKRVQNMSARREKPFEPGTIHFTLGQLDTEHFPEKEWKKIMYNEVRYSVKENDEEAFQSEGHLPLRKAIAQYLQRARGIKVKETDVVIVNGSMQAIVLLSQLLIHPGDQVLMENPGFSGFKKAIEACGGVPIPAKTDEEGIIADSDWKSRLLFVTSGRQFPTGTVLSMDRRLLLLKWASKQDAVIVEDDYDSEFRRKGKPSDPLKVLDSEERVVYIGTFSKTIRSDLRLGYVVLPRSLQEPFCKAKQLYDPHPVSLLQQRAVASFINGGHFERHLRRMNRVYGEKRELLQKALQERLGELFQCIETNAGLHVFAWWKRSQKEFVIFQSACEQRGIRWSDPAYHFIGDHTPAAIFGFSHLSLEQIDEGTRMMAEVWKSNKLLV